MAMDVNDLSYEELEKLFQDDEPTPEASPENNGTTSQTENGGTADAQNNANVDTTKAFAKRLKESTDKAVSAEREAIAKSLGFASYDEMMKSNMKKMYEDNGLDESTVSPIVDKLVEERLKNDPRLKELEGYKQKQLQEFAKAELAEVSKLTGGEITQLSQLPKEVIDLWKQTGSLKGAYLQIEGEKLIAKARNEQSKGSTQHMQQAQGSTPPGNGVKRPLTTDEKKVYKFFNPSVTDDELNKLTKDA